MISSVECRFLGISSLLLNGHTMILAGPLQRGQVRRVGELRKADVAAFLDMHLTTGSIEIRSLTETFILRYGAVGS